MVLCFRFISHLSFFSGNTAHNTIRIFGKLWKNKKKFLEYRVFHCR